MMQGLTNVVAFMGLDGVDVMYACFWIFSGMYMLA